MAPTISAQLMPLLAGTDFLTVIHGDAVVYLTCPAAGLFAVAATVQPLGSDSQVAMQRGRVVHETIVKVVSRLSPVYAPRLTLSSAGQKNV